jgi:hypothetical protein
VVRGVLVVRGLVAGRLHGGPNTVKSLLVKVESLLQMVGASVRNQAQVTMVIRNPR